MKKLTTDEMHRLSIEQYREAEKLPLTVVLDNVRSQNNIGSVFRTSDAFRIEKICLCGICSTPPHRDIHKTALGAEESVDWQYYASTLDCLLELKDKGYHIYAIEQVDDSIKLNDFSKQYRPQQAPPCPPQVPPCPPQEPTPTSRTAIPTPMPMAVIFGNEVEGVDATLLDARTPTGAPLCEGCIEIPQYGTKHSLNISCAAAIVLWELQKLYPHRT